ncbi:hypothetical protein Hanom_Chr10g00890681 [Helianthus anomalus]
MSYNAPWWGHYNLLPLHMVLMEKKDENTLDLTRKMDVVNGSDENDKISNLLDPDAKKQTFARKSQSWPSLMDENDILLQFFLNLRLPNPRRILLWHTWIM